MVPKWIAYEVGPEEPRAGFPGQPVMRPLLSVTIEGPSHGAVVKTQLLVDSGSEYTLVTRAYARRLGIGDALSSCPHDTVLIGGQAARAELITVNMHIQSFPRFEALVGFVRPWTFSHAGVLGQRGFFDHFGVLFDRVNLRFGLYRQDEIDKQYPPPPAR